ncbi:PAS domain S-box protein [Legionella israelensis]|uniref:sensor histidine kinase n=1 Tax=Legionella israelensis TaxID=454 RepID=UPI00117D8CA9|nr:PAS domain-containing sensor histidine kinase [Legionella israelensis]QDP72681.1 PAS domain S-box protein [Legionella israelensis]
MDIHKLLKRQMKNLELNFDTRPENNEKWHEFIARVNKAYIDADQEHYLNERSIDISSRELMALNQKLENAQRIAKMGYWYYEGNNDYTVWSKELFSLFNLNPNEKPPSYKEFLVLVHEEDRKELKDKVEKALTEGKDYECEIRVKNTDGQYRWYRTIAQSQGNQQISGVVIDIHKDKMAEEKIKELSNQLVDTARRAGMAEVASSVLHNIGNVLNSSNISIDQLKTSHSGACYQKFFKIIEMLSEHMDDLPDYLTRDSKGQLIPKYLSSLSQMLIEEEQKNQAEINNLVNDLNHINEIVSLQKSVSGLSSINEKVYIPDVIESALNMTMSSCKDESIKIYKKFNECPLIFTDKSKLLQIIVNLIQNAKDAVLQNNNASVKEIKLVLNKCKDNKVQIKVIDNGIGIEADNIKRIFAFGFTTKPQGHGFGLHSSALSAQEMGGALRAESTGYGKGAHFILTLPMTYNSVQKGIFNE